MASISTAARFSAIASDPLRSFKYYAEFSVAGSQPFSTKIIDSGGQAGAAVGTSSGFVGGFTQISGLNINIQDITYREGGYNTTAHHLPGLATFPPVTFQRGVLYGNDQAQVWMRGLFALQSPAYL